MEPALHKPISLKHRLSELSSTGSKASNAPHAAAVRPADTLQVGSFVGHSRAGAQRTQGDIVDLRTRAEP